MLLLTNTLYKPQQSARWQMGLIRYMFNQFVAEMILELQFKLTKCIIYPIVFKNIINDQAINQPREKSKKIFTEQGKSKGFYSCDWPCNIVEIRSWVAIWKCSNQSQIVSFLNPWNWEDGLQDRQRTSSVLLQALRIILNHHWIKTRVTVQKHTIWVKIGDFLTQYVWPWNLTDDLGK